MGQMVNTNAYKLGIAKFWLNKLPGKTSLLYVVINRIVIYFFAKRALQMESFIFSHLFLKHGYRKNILIDIYVYHGRSLQDLYRKRRKLKYNAFKRNILRFVNTFNYVMALRKFFLAILKWLRFSSFIKNFVTVSLLKKKKKINIRKIDFFFRWLQGFFYLFIFKQKGKLPFNRFFLFLFILKLNKKQS